MGMSSSDANSLLKLDTTSIGRIAKPVGSSNRKLLKELTRRVNISIKLSRQEGVPQYEHALPKRGKKVEWPPNGAEVWENSKGHFLMKSFGIIKKANDLFDRTELTGYFLKDGTLFWVESCIRVYDSKTGLPDPYVRHWDVKNGELRLEWITAPKRIRTRDGMDFVKNVEVYVRGR